MPFRVHSKVHHDQTSYTTTAIALHWLMFVLILCAWTLGLYMVDLPLSPQKLKYFSWHKWLGVTIFLIAVVRVLWRMSHPAPPLAHTIPPRQQRAAGIAHFLLYVLILMIPLSGWIYSSATGIPVVYFGVVQLPDLVGKDKALAEILKQTHIYLNLTLFGIVCVHVAAALKHQLVDHSDVLSRMLPFLGNR